jgi:TRAP-type C4-dicarboxylate transport system substrate-binding protein
MRRQWPVVMLAGLLAGLDAGPGWGEPRPLELRLPSWVGIGHNHHRNVLEPWARMVEEKSRGRLKVTIYPGGTLGRPADHWDMMKDGIADIGYGTYNYTAGRFPLTSVGDLPFLFKTARGGSRVM